MSFKIGSDIELPFEVQEYSVVLRLHAKGVYMTENTSVESEWFVRIFGSKTRSISHGKVLQKLREEAAQQIAALKVELRKKDVAIARLARKLQRARAGVFDDDSEGECEDESDGDEEHDADYGEEETADRMDVELERKQLHEDEEDQTDEDLEEEKHGEKEEKQAHGEEKQGQEEEKKTEEEKSQAEEDPDEAVEERMNTERRSKNKMDILLAEIDPINESDYEGVGSLQEFNQLMAIVPYIALIDVKPADESNRETCSRAADSSIVRCVMARKDRKRKKKPEFVTPVSTPRIKKAKKSRRAKGKSAADVNNEQEPFVVGDDGDSDAAVGAELEAQKWEGYRNNDSYCGKGTLSEDETNTIEQFFASFAVQDIVWQQGVVSVSSDSVLELLFDEAVKGEVIDAYLHHLCSNEYHLQHNPQKAVNDALS
ncbi:uncharacterized protein LOC127250165 [Andrographis paniculata]|uniref:uncharacterized protein LOC127250165 n=1 Tax=Andrographis paniculata TaxID=175694 RepID=UPI0021E9661A|nr:uncharacterized protein LOC127250165 [Andrographis paniculata]